MAKFQILQIQCKATDKIKKTCFYSAGNTIEEEEFSVSTLLEKANANVGMSFSKQLFYSYTLAQLSINQL